MKLSRSQSAVTWASDDGPDEAPEIPDVIPTPQEMVAVLDEYIIGQENAKIALSVAVYNHYKRGSGDHTLHLLLVLAAEGAAHRFIVVSCHGSSSFQGHPGRNGHL